MNRLTFPIGDRLLDTNIVVAFIESDEEIVKNVQKDEQIAVCIVTLGELYFGAEKSGRRVANIARIDFLAARAIIYDMDTETARHYGRIKAELRRKGRPIPENDMWIAAVAMQHGLTLVTRDAHFAEIDNLTVERW